MLPLPVRVICFCLVLNYKYLLSPFTPLGEGAGGGFARHDKARIVVGYSSVRSPDGRGEE